MDQQIHRAYKTKVRPTRNQEQYLKQCGRVARTVFNWVLADYMADYGQWHMQYSQAKEAGLIPDKVTKSDWPLIQKACADAGIVLSMKPQPAGRVARKKRLNVEKKIDSRLQFVTKYPYVILESAIDHFDAAMKRYNDKKKDGSVARKIAERMDSIKHKRRYAKMKEKGRVGEQLDPYFPRFKRRDDDCSFTLRGSIHIERNRIKLPVIGWVRLAESDYLPNNPIKLSEATISFDGNDWFLSVSCVVQVKQPELQPITLGVSVGVMDLVATSTGAVYENPRVLAQNERKKTRLQRELSRRTVRGANWKKTKVKLARLESKIASVRAHHQHNTSRWIVDTQPETIVLKKMNVQEMMSDNPAAKYLSDAGMGELTRQIAYKAEWNGTKVVGATGVIYCSRCKSESIKVSYATRMMSCGACGHTMRASVNTAMNLSEVEHA